MSKKEETIVNVKVVILGEPGVGKTCIANRLVNNVYKEVEPTTGASYSQRIIHFDQHDKSVKFDIWDTAGQERYRSMNKIFYKDAKVAVLVYDITRKSSFNEIKNFWVTQIKENGDSNAILAIAANKADLYEHEEIEEGIGREFADQVGAIFRYTSAKNSSGIDELFSSIGDKILNPQKKEEESIQQAPKDKKVILYNSPKDKPKEGGCCK